MTASLFRVCKECGAVKAASDFYASNKGRCKECIKAGVRANRLDKAEYYRAYDRARYHSDPKRREASEKLHATQSADGRMAGWKRDWINRNPEARKAHNAVSNAKQSGKLIPGPCEVCGTTENIHAHHDDYSKPLKVRWLCVVHHSEHHLNERDLPIAVSLT